MKKLDCALVYVDVRGIEIPFSYKIPNDLINKIEAGSVVQVPINSREVLGFVVALENSEDKKIELKYITELVCDYIVFKPEALELAKWMSERYFASFVACLNIMLPPSFSLKKRKSKPLVEKAKKVEKAVKNKKNINSAEIEKEKIILTPEQNAAIARISESINAQNGENILLRGVTGSGKTEVYIRALALALEKNKQGIVLVPEISLTPQITDRFRARFGELVGVSHSRLAPKERLKLWNDAREGNIKIIIGPRSVIFTPFSELGIIIIDEEHENAYVSEQSPKYDAREIARKRASAFGATLIMGSATPSLEAYYKSASGEYALIEMNKRPGGSMPKVEIIDMRKELLTGNSSIFGQAFLNFASVELKAGNQLILFLNRRGYSFFASCRSCGHVMGCKYCAVNLTYHLTDKSLRCHICGFNQDFPEFCPICKSVYVRRFGVGAQKVEEECRKIFPNRTVLRMDADATKKRGGHEKIINAFQNGEAQILVGTQMIAKGLDFPNATGVCVVAADQSLNMGDFRSAEFTFRILTQVCGRAGRAEKLGRAFLQTYNPNHYAIEYAKTADYEGFYYKEIQIRKIMNYPPFSHILIIMLNGEDEKKTLTEARALRDIATLVSKNKPYEILGPAPAFISKIKNRYRQKILIKGFEPEKLSALGKYCVKKLEELKKARKLESKVFINLTLDPPYLE